MPIRTIDDKRYKGISELYRKSDGKVTGYYVTFRDENGKPVKRRVDADNRDEALRKLVDIKEEVDLKKREKSMTASPSTAPKKAVQSSENTRPTVSRERVKTAKQNGSVQSMQACQKRLVQFQGAATVLLFEIVAFEDICILYGYEDASRFVTETEALIKETLNEMKRDGLSERQGFDPLQFELHHLYADRFCLFLKNDFSHRMLDYIVEAVLESVGRNSYEVTGGSSIDLNITVGAAKADSAVSLMHAEKALREAKRFNSSYLFYDCRSSEAHSHLVNKTFETLIDNIRGRKVTPHFQGIFSVKELSKPAKFESLMRLVDTEGRYLAPSAFLEKSKEYRLYTQLMFQMIDKVFDVLSHHDTCVTLNLSFNDINNVRICDRLVGALQNKGMGSRLTIEIVESDQIRDIELVNAFIFKLKKYGVRIAIDDFGSGFSNFDNLLNLEIDYVKLDGSLISKLHDRKHRIIIENIVKLCKDLGIQTIGEYISDVSIMRLAMSIGIDYLQGHYLHKPQPWDEAAGHYAFGEVSHAT